MRHSLHSLLGSSKIPSVKGMQATVSALLENLNKYSNDKTSVWKYVYIVCVCGVCVCVCVCVCVYECM